MIGSTTWKKFLLIHYARLTTLIAILAAVSGCGTAKTIQQNVVVRDTIVITKERVLHDTLTIQKDTILYQDRVRVEVKYLEGKRVVITAECPSDTIRVETIKIVNQPVQKQKMTWEGFAGWMVVVLCLLVILRAIVQKIL
jgi:hypothetical protein